MIRPGFAAERLSDAFLFSPEDVLKAGILANGLVIDEGTRAFLAGSADRPIGAQDGYPTTEGPTFVLGPDTWVTTPGSKPRKGASKLIVANGCELIVKGPDGFETPAKFVRPAVCHNQKLSNGYPLTEYVAIHGLRARFSLVASGNKPDGLGGGCALNCTMCPLAKSVSGYGGIKSKELLLEAAEVVRQERAHPANHVLISGGSPQIGDYEKFHNTCVAIIEAFPDRPVDLMAVPLPGSLDFKALKEAGLTGMSINPEAHPETEFAKGLSVKAALQKRGFYRNAIKAAVAAGLKVRSLVLIPGGMSPRDTDLTHQLIREIIDAGATPILSPLQDDPDAPKANLLRPTVGEILALAAKTRELIAFAGNTAISHTLNCSACAHNVFPSPTAPGYAVPSSASAGRFLHTTLQRLPADCQPQTI